MAHANIGKLLVQLAFAALAVQPLGCASTQQQSDSAEGENYENSGSESGDNSESAAEDNIANPESTNLANNAGGDNNGYENAGGEEVNNAPADEFSDLLNNTQGQQAGNIAEGEYQNSAPAEGDYMTADAGGDYTANAVPPMTTGQSANEIPTNSAAPLPESAAPAMPVPKPGGMVKYVTRRTNVLAQPQGAVVGSFDRGDHPVVWAEDQWSRLSDGTYLNSTALSTTPVGRQRSPSSWR